MVYQRKNKNGQGQMVLLIKYAFLPLKRLDFSFVI